MTKKNIMTIETIKEDLKYQLTFEDFDWDYFINLAKEGKKLSVRKFREDNNIVREFRYSDIEIDEATCAPICKVLMDGKKTGEVFCIDPTDIQSEKYKCLTDSLWMKGVLQDFDPTDKEIDGLTESYKNVKLKE